MPGIGMGAPGMPPLNIGSSATSDAKGGTNSGGGFGTLNEGDWVTQATGTGDNTSLPGPKAVPVNSSVVIYCGLAVAAAWFLSRR